MRQCPKCGHIDPPNWRPPPFGPDFDYVRFDEFRELLPDLADEIAHGGIGFDELYAYRASKTRKYVYRVWLPIWRAFGEGRPWAVARRTKMYDSAGRTDKKAWGRMLSVMGKRRRKNISERLEKWFS